MSGLAGLLAGHAAPGVWRWESALEVADVEQAVRTAGWDFAHVDGWTAATTKADALDAFGEALSFPEHYGRNLDALHDCLRDVGDVLLLWDGWSTLARSDARTFAVVLDILGERASAAGAPFAVLLRGDGPELPEVALLS